jgi:hypothetical protein
VLPQVIPSTVLMISPFGFLCHNEIIWGHWRWLQVLWSKKHSKLNTVPWDIWLVKDPFFQECWKRFYAFCCMESKEWISEILTTEMLLASSWLHSGSVLWPSYNSSCFKSNTWWF